MSEDNRTETVDCKKAQNCDNCKEMEELKAENRQLLKEQEILFLLMDLGMSAVELWGEKNGLLGGDKNIDKNFSDGDNQIGMFLDQIGKFGKDSGTDRLAAFLDFLQRTK